MSTLTKKMTIKKKKNKTRARAESTVKKDLRGTFNRRYILKEEFEDDISVDDKEMMDEAIWVHFVQP